MNNLTFEVKAILGLESTIQEGQPAGFPDGGRTDGEAGNRTSYNPGGFGTGAALGNIYYEYTKTIYSYR